MPVGMRVSKVIINSSGSTWNLKRQYLTSLIYKSCPGPAVRSSFRVNVPYAIPVNF